jgi:hypothetical protein
MPTVDFTKAELLTDIRGLIGDLESRIIDRIEARIVAEREYTKQMMVDALMSFWDSNFEPAFQRLEEDYSKHGQLLAQHSQDIMELRARRA